MYIYIYNNNIFFSIEITNTYILNTIQIADTTFPLEKS